ncbi:MAG TPA: ABC transporter permease [Jatrophihabitans sp.]|nr:ABC transporter permease [Jatrophihabitans sp.]
MISAFTMEWQKLLPLHRTSRTMGVAVALAVVVSAVVAAAMAAHGSHMTASDRLGFDSMGVSLQGVNAAVLAVGVFGVLTVTREYGSGMIRTTFMAHPSRLRVLAAKLATHAAVAGVAAVVACLAAFAAGQAVLGTGGLSDTWGDPRLPSALGGAVVYLLLICAWGVGLGALLRSTSSAITWLASLLVVAPVIVQILPQSTVDLVGRWLPSQIGQQAITANPSPHAFAEWNGLAVLGAYAALTLLAGAWRMARSDP